MQGRVLPTLPATGFNALFADDGMTNHTYRGLTIALPRFVAFLTDDSGLSPGRFFRHLDLIG